MQLPLVTVKDPQQGSSMLPPGGRKANLTSSFESTASALTGVQQPVYNTLPSSDWSGAHTMQSLVLHLCSVVAGANNLRHLG
jgi:hypothetical protein